MHAKEIRHLAAVHFSRYAVVLTFFTVHQDQTSCFYKMCKPNTEVFVPVLVGDEDAELRRAQEEPLLPRRLDDEDEDDEGCDHITWLILLGGILFLLTVYTMPCSCNFVDDVEQHGVALLRGATAKLLRQKDSMVGSTNKDDRLRSHNLKPVRIASHQMILNEDYGLDSSDESSSSDFHVYSGLPKSDSDDDFHVYSGLPKRDDDEFHVYSGLPKELQDDDDFDLPMLEDEGGNDDEEVEQVVAYKMKKRPRRSSKHSTLPHGIFTTKWLNHNFISMNEGEEDAELRESKEERLNHKFVSFSGSGDNAEAQLLESKEESPSIELDETSHTLPSNDDEMDSITATELSTSVGENDASHPGYTVSYDEVGVSDSASDDENDEIEVDSVLPERRSLVQRKTL
jgi:hypothetical protein